jgi:membrane-associated phospholipid phosphatase
MKKDILQFVFVLFFGLIFAVICNLFLDYPVSLWFCENEFNVIERARFTASSSSDSAQIQQLPERHNMFTKWVLLFEFFGHPLCFLLVLVLCFFLDVCGRIRLVRFVFCVFTSQAIVALVKFSIYRKRPVVNDFTMSSFDVTGFIGSNGLHSFPSGHTALAVVMALCLVSIYPRGRYVFYFAALAVAFERIFDCRHYLSDTVIGGLISYLVWFFCYKLGFIAGKFNNIESAAELKLQDNCNKNQPTILFSTPSLGTVSGKRFSSGIHQFLHKDTKPIEHIQTKNDTNEIENIDNKNKANNNNTIVKNDNVNNDNVNVNKDKNNDANNIKESNTTPNTPNNNNNTPKPPKRPRSKNNLPFNNFRNR